MTTSEWRVWSYLRKRQLDGWKFRRQVPIGPYVVDFVCFAARLVVELDGNSHDDVKFEYDERRQAWLEAKGFKVLRLSTDYPELDPIEGAWDAIDVALSEIASLGAPSGAARHLPGKRGGLSFCKASAGAPLSPLEGVPFAANGYTKWPPLW